jgi:hypothetical protein
VAVPILEAIALADSSDPRSATLQVLGNANSDAETKLTVAALLDDGYLTGATAHWGLGSGRPNLVMDVLRLTPKGRRAVGQWPSGVSGALFIEALERKVSEIGEGEEKTKLRSLLAAARGVSVDVLSGVVSDVLKGTLGLPQRIAP